MSNYCFSSIYHRLSFLKGGIVGKAIVNDVLDTCSDMSDMERDFGFKAEVDVQEGVRRYVAWFREYYDR